MKITVLSDGGWGTALALLLHRNGHQTVLWGPFRENIELIRETRENRKFLAGIKIPQELILTTEIDMAVDRSEIIVLATPSQYMRETLKILQPHYKPSQTLVNVAKGIENNTLFTMSRLCREILGQCAYTVLSGPSHAEEVARNKPTAVVAASQNLAEAEKVQQVFMNQEFRVYTSDDVIGVELGGSLKNVFAIAAGIIDGMELGDNPKAALITRGITEMARLGIALGGRAETFSGLSGIGDMIVTCYSGHSRNRHVGEELGRGRKLAEIITEMGMVVAEGVKTAKSTWRLAREQQIETPITNQIYNILYQNRDPRQSVQDLMNRQARKERDDHV